MIKPLIGTIIMGGVMLTAKLFLPVTLNTVIVLSILGLAVYLTSMLTMMGLTLVEDAKRSFKTIFGKN